MAPKYKLTYFDARGISEPIRYLFKYGNIDFDDNRIKDEEWEKFKPKTPFGVLPLLEIDGTVIGESTAISRYVGKIVGLSGNNDLENLQIDSIVDSYKDFFKQATSAYWNPDETKKKELQEKVKSESYPFYFSKFEEIVKKNGFLALNRLTWADFLLAGHVLLLNLYINVDIGKDYPNLGALIKKIENLPGVQKWIETRPVTEL